MPKIEVKNISKVYKKEKVLDDVSFCVNQGEIFGIVGRNGSGKSVLMKIICGLAAPTNGEIVIDEKIIGKDVDFPENLGAVIDQPSFMQFSSGFKNLKFLADINKKISADEIRVTMEMVGLNPDSKKWVMNYSLGMKQRLSIAQAIMEKPDLMILDEPMNGFDKEMVNWLRRYLKEESDRGCTIIISSHIQEDIDILCDHVIELDGGCIVNAR